jgi:hypothetical protein
MSNGYFLIFVTLAAAIISVLYFGGEDQEYDAWSMLQVGATLFVFQLSLGMVFTDRSIRDLLLLGSDVRTTILCPFTGYYAIFAAACLWVRQRFGGGQ